MKLVIFKPTSEESGGCVYTMLNSSQ